MKLQGVYKRGNEEYFVFVQYSTALKNYVIYAPVANKDKLAYEMGAELTFPELDSITEFNESKDKEEYFVGALKVAMGVRISYSGNYTFAKAIAELLKFAERYHFTKDNCTEYKYTNTGITYKSFSGSDSILTFAYNMQNGEYSSLNIKYGQESFELVETTKFPKVKNIKYEELQDTSKEDIIKATFKTIHYKDLENCLDMSWYRENGVTKKKYVGIHTIEEFEDMFSKMMEAACKTEQLVVALDTETTGVVVYDLEKDNPALSRCVEISVSWADDEAYCIFTKMEYIQSLSAEYVFKRFAEIFTEDRGYVTITWNGGKRTEVFARDRFHLVGQNFPFDRRVSIVEGGRLWFDDDTLNMGFNIDPRVVRGNVKLKNMTRRIFHHETPELTDLLGKGNEDKYALLEDEEVACIYAGADADYTRKLWFVLKDMLGPKMYHMYHKQDVKMLNILAVSEYYGLRVKDKEAKELAIKAEKNLSILKNTAYLYVGAYMDYQEKASILDAQYMSNMITEEEYAKAYASIEVDKNAKYEFEFKSADIRAVMYDILKYPIFSYTDTGIAKVDKYVRKKLLKEKRKPNSTARTLQHSVLVADTDYAEYERLLNGSEEDRKKAEKLELISASKFNELEYPLALLFEKYAVLNKEYTSYFKPMLEDNLESKIFKSYSLARIETRRIMNPSQTMKKDLKKLVIPTSDDYYSVDFDLSQIELRLMYSKSGSTELIEKMKNPESDAHTETAAMVNRIPAYQVTKDQRKGAKSVSFGEPYGLGIGSLCETIFGDRSKEHMVMTRIIVHSWEKANYRVMEMLNKARDQALEPVDLPLAKRNFMDAWQKDPKTKEYLLDEYGKKIPIPMGAVYNSLGFCRYFDLTNIGQTEADKARRAQGEYTPEESTIRRAAGNYPIQSYAAEFFRLILYRFYDRCKEEGIADKVVWNMLIHDELLCSVHKSVNPILIVKIVKEACMITMKGHTNYFVGINIGDNWKETKDDSRELPVILVERLIKRWDAGEFRGQDWFDHPWEMIGPLRADYVKTRIYEVLKALQSDIDSAPIDLGEILKKFSNYTVRAYVYDYPKNFKVPKDTPELIADDVEYQSHFESWMLDYFGEGKELIGIDGKLKKVSKAGTVEKTVIANAFDEEDDFAMPDDDDDVEGDIFDDIDNDTLDVTYRATLQDLSDDTGEEEECFDYEKLAVHKYNNLRVRGETLEIDVDNSIQMHTVMNSLEEGKGKLVLFRCNGKVITWKKTITTVDLAELDDFVSNLRAYPKGIECIGNRMIVSIKQYSSQQRLSTWVRQNKGSGYVVYSKCGKTASSVFVGSIKSTASFKELEEILCQ
mgnify:CR=1 FL=1